MRPEAWPRRHTVVDAKLEARLDALLAGMTDQEIVGQTIMADLASVTPDDLREVPLGAVLNGGNSAPGGDNRCLPSAYLETVDAFHAASRARGGAAVPILWGTDAVHGHNNAVGATVFPHNIGLGAAGDEALVREAARATAAEVLATGMDWTFAPCVSIGLDPRWGRTFESYGSGPALVARLTRAAVEGLQDGFGEGRGILACAKHYLGDGATEGGRDQGDATCTEEVLRDVHAAGYYAALDAGVQTVMASLSSWRGVKLHGHEGLLTKVLKGRMGFDGLILGDWNGHGRVPGCTNGSCVAAFEAGLDMAMAPDSWRDLYADTLAALREGRLSRERITDAARRVLRVKLRANLWDRPRPSARPGAGVWTTLGAAAHREAARRAAASSLVLLKARDGALPIAPSARILVAGDGADSLPKACGGWTLTWQGDGNANADLPSGRTLHAALAEKLSAKGGQAVLSEDGSYDVRPDLAVVVFGEEPYAEFQGDRDDLDFRDERPLTILNRLREAGVPSIAVYLGGRPLYLNPEIEASDAFIAAWLPGTGIEAVADALMAGPQAFTARLPTAWPASPVHTCEVPFVLFEAGYGLSAPGGPEGLDVSERSVSGDEKDELVRAGRPRPGLSMHVTDDASLRIIDVFAQEDAREVDLPAGASLQLTGEPRDLTRQANARLGLRLHVEVLMVGEGRVNAGVASGTARAVSDVAPTLREAEGRGWRWIFVPIRADSEDALRGVDALLLIEAEAPLRLRLTEARLGMQQPSDLA